MDLRASSTKLRASPNMRPEERASRKMTLKATWEQHTCWRGICDYVDHYWGWTSGPNHKVEGLAKHAARGKGLQDDAEGRLEEIRRTTLMVVGS
jgi:hypothetical protein